MMKAGGWKLLDVKYKNAHKALISNNIMTTNNRESEHEHLIAMTRLVKLDSKQIIIFEVDFLE